MLEFAEREAARRLDAAQQRHDAAAAALDAAAAEHARVWNLEEQREQGSEAGADADRPDRADSEDERPPGGAPLEDVTGDSDSTGSPAPVGVSIGFALEAGGGGVTPLAGTPSRLPRAQVC